jgi:hypothetical protein
MAAGMADANDRRRRGRNLALGAVLLGLVVLFYVMTVVRFGGQP